MVLCVGGTFAAEASEYDYSTAYFAFGAGFGTITDLPTGAPAADVAVGYSFNRYLALEGDYSTMPSSQWGWLSNYSLYTAAVKGILPVSDHWSLYGKLGSGLGYSSWSGTLGSPTIYNSEGSASAWVAQASAGVNVALSDHFSLYLENNTYFNLNGQPGSYATTNTTLFGFQYNFSAPRATQASSVNNYQSAVDANLASRPETNVVVVSSKSPVVIMPATTPVASACVPACQPNQLESVPARSLASRMQIDGAAHQYVVIEHGDTLYSLSKNSGVAITTLRSLNHLVNDHVVIAKRFYFN